MKPRNRVAGLSSTPATSNDSYGACAIASLFAFACFFQGVRTARCWVDWGVARLWRRLVLLFSIPSGMKKGCGLLTYRPPD